MAMLISAARRSRALAKMQMEFVAGVSHELCTPLAVINSAAENLADGVVETPEQMQEYGGMIRGQGRRLERLVDGVLLFTAGRFGLSGYEMAPLDVAAVAEQSLTAAEPTLRDAGFTLEKEIARGLPLVMADASAVTTCIENMINNAIKYSDATKWVAVRTRVACNGAKPEVQIQVEDKGVGIPPVDLPHILEPFRARHPDQRRGPGPAPGEAHDGRHGRTRERYERAGPGHAGHSAFFRSGIRSSRNTGREVARNQAA
jgi:signal transduction histidine kinase